ncbi:hypothetical protein [Streptomyces sp. NPDC020965]|uniref:hypothetical protein n=1 Tax=Streptomyces sp. NPDC020965 TaxID=3365105 RepID=UPI003788DFEA
MTRWLASGDPIGDIASVVATMAVFCTAVLAGWVTFWLVRYLRADTMTRVSIRQAARIRRGWPRLARMAGLSVVDRTPTGLTALLTPPGRTASSRVLVPKIQVRPDAFGVQVRMACLPRVGLAELQRAAPYLADAWRSTRVVVSREGPGHLRIRAVRRDPLAAPTHHTPVLPRDLSHWALGVDEYAEDVVVSLANVPGVTVAGLPGFGKTSLIYKLICDLAASPPYRSPWRTGRRRRRRRATTPIWKSGCSRSSATTRPTRTPSSRSSYGCDGTGRPPSGPSSGCGTCGTSVPNGTGPWSCS